MIQNKDIDLNNMISKIRPLNEWEKSFEDLIARKAVKIILKPNMNEAINK